MLGYITHLCVFGFEKIKGAAECWLHVYWVRLDGLIFTLDEDVISLDLF